MECTFYANGMFGVFYPTVHCAVNRGVFGRQLNKKNKK